MRRILAAFALVSAVAACSVDPGPDRTGTVVQGIRVDSLRFLPFGSRFVPRDSSVRIAFIKYHAGYVCSRFLDLRLDDGPSGDPPAYRPYTRVSLPGSEECAIDTGGRDTIGFHVFAGDSLARLANSSGKVTDMALVVAGRLDADSIRGVLGADRAFSAGNLTYRDSSSLPGPELKADSLPACRYLNSAESEKSGKDTVVLRLTWVTLDPAPGNGFCGGDPHSDSAPVRPRRSLWMGERAVFP